MTFQAFGDRRASRTKLCSNLWRIRLVTTITRDTSKATLASDVSSHLIHALSTHGQTRHLDSMHACLNVDEIVRLIAHELVASSGERTAVCLACCCKRLEDPVLDTLWAKQETLLPLLKSLPCDVWKEGRYNVSASTQCLFSLSNYSIRKSFKRLPTTTEWARFQKYARRMRELRQCSTPVCPSLETLSAMQLYTINEPLLTNLKTLEMTEIEGWFIPFIPLFLSPRTTSITLGFGFSLPKAMVTSVITTLPTLRPDLQTIGLYSLPSDPAITATVSEMLLNINRNTLQRFHVDSPLTEDASKSFTNYPTYVTCRCLLRGRPRYPQHRFQI